MIEDTPVAINSKADLIDACLKNLEASKAHDIVGIDLKENSSVCDYMLIASGTSNRHVAAMAFRLETFLHRCGIRDITVSGAQLGEWVILDLGTVLVHILQEPVRDRYRLEDLYRCMATGINTEDL